MARKTIEDLFVHELSDIYSAEKQITRACRAWHEQLPTHSWLRPSTLN
ncbi:Uncharacterised protein [Pseudomonas fluorescens]|uniref:Uncharacterized protein n=1 Tax=Pseudomonas fluorescens TaxID=294 RepID=A0A448DYN2_PSEFL|nr:Uncharacterised protein [Pseudomonas fluorescens]